MRDMSRFRPKRRLRVREVAAGVLALAGLVLLAAEAGTVGGQLVCALCGFGLWGLAWLCWRLDRVLYLARKTAHCLREALREELAEAKAGRAA